MANGGNLRLTDTGHAQTPSSGRQPKGSRVIWLSVATLAGAVAWASVAHLDQISRATGQVIPAGRVQVVQTTDGGVISAILVREGDSVRKGQKLVTLDQVKVRAAVDEGAAKVGGLEAQQARINAELFDRPLAFTGEAEKFPNLVASQRALFAKRRMAFSDQIAALNHQLDLATRELEMNRPLLRQGDVSRSEILRLERQQSDIQSQIANLRNRYYQELQTDYAKSNEELVTAREILTQRRASLGETQFVAPTDGIVKNVHLTTIGGVLRPGDEVLQIVPTGQELIVEAKVSPTDIAYVRTGQSASVKFDAYDSSIFGSAEGKVGYISPDTLTENGAGAAQDRVFYRVHVRVDTRSMVRRPGEPIAIQPGMTATVEIKTGSNTVLRYLLKPIIKTMSGAMGEH
ncbi:adhesin transport system membrane fusion protein [Novosphingobium sp. SG751A]|uniref:HlyD family efflux transporter periplasmic adaptor subunit n=1 Tax=Novosphingobium sp. SG751A TaxID=2587000 RepID=UPI001558161B|nr:HlyD family efflux transporter periplasmic adaptor subunit [Novosphingobium sp. SG751A]NOW47713.1 adhesin transport system membrane fusion protein [Novosphingobium sp. SG751A]